MRVKTIHPSLKALFLFFIYTALPASLVYVIISAMGLLSDPDVNKSIGILYYSVMVILVLEVIRRYFNNSYIIHTDKIVAIQGLLSFHLSRNTIDYLDIREIKTNQTILGRMLDYGDLLISTASTSGIEITLKIIDDVDKINQEILKYKNALQSSLNNE